MATKIKKSEFAGVGMFLQLLGVVLCFVLFPVGLIAGLILLIYGGVKANVLKCSDCRGKVEKEARVCPHCRADFGGVRTAGKDSVERNALR